jgi:hypothetical protein
MAVEVTGPVVVILWAASDAPDTDFVARLIDVDPDGFARNLTDGIIRARFRDGFSTSPSQLPPGIACKFTIDMWATANVFKAGHCIRLHISSASYPRWSRNPNTGGTIAGSEPPKPAQQTIFHDVGHPSQIVLPIVPR